MCAISKEDREMNKMLQETKKFGLDDDSDDSSNHEFQFEIKDPATLAKSRKLFNKTNTNDSVSTFNTHDDTMGENKNARDDESVTSKNPSPQKKSRATSPDDSSTFEDTNTNIDGALINAVENGLNTLQNMMNAFFKSQNFTYSGTNLQNEMNSAAKDNDSERLREVSQIVPETPEAGGTASGESL